MIHSRLTSKAQTTIPRAVRTALGVKEGDVLAYVIDGDRVVISRAATPELSADNPYALFTEWSDALDSAYDNL